jgi:hypothetical protein
LPDLSLLDDLEVLDVTGVQLTGNVPNLIIAQLETFVTEGSSIPREPVVEAAQGIVSAGHSAVSPPSTAMLVLVLFAMFF